MHVYVLVCTQTEIRTRTVVGWYSYRTYSLSISYTLINYLSMYLYIHVHCLYSYAVLARSVVGTRSTLGRCVAAVTSMLRPSNVTFPPPCCARSARAALNQWCNANTVLNTCTRTTTSVRIGTYSYTLYSQLSSSTVAGLPGLPL